METQNKTNKGKWKVLNDEDEEEYARYFKTKEEAIFYIMCSSGYSLTNTQEIGRRNK